MPDAEPTTDTTTTDAPPPDAPTDQVDPEELKKQLATERRRAAQLDAENRKFRDQQKAADDAKLSEIEKRDLRIRELEAAVAERDTKLSQVGLRSDALIEAGRLGFQDPEDAWLWLQANTAKVETDKDGRPTNLAELLEKDLLVAKPYLAGPRVATPSGNGGARGGQVPQDMNALIRGR